MLLADDERHPLLDSLQCYMQSCSGAQRAVAERLACFVRSTPDCFQRSHAAGHITGSAWLLNPGGDKVLLTRHRKLQKWLQPGGHADGDADTLRVSLREACEESGIGGIIPVSPHIFDVDIHTIPARPAAGETEHLHYDVRYLLRAPHESFAVSDESDALAWFSYDDLLQMQPLPDESVMRMADLWRKSLADHTRTRVLNPEHQRKV